ncbi:hypothetical protein CRG98_035157 [Punica granatum]|uniref:Uncharacterized protein n=1 Tax=Punica granatum TaxID=22663 RepID=A0A2I0IK93_PUNGR|nr:hypothetical protein CRG98_035157 [Punica granatum]
MECSGLVKRSARRVEDNGPWNTWPLNAVGMEDVHVKKQWAPFLQVAVRKKKIIKASLELHLHVLIYVQNLTFLEFEDTVEQKYCATIQTHSSSNARVVIRLCST